jgi:flagella basal body P-ring formation protein FlgA
VARPVAKDEVITADTLRVKQMSLSQMPRQVVSRPEDVIGKRAKRPLQANTTLHTYEVEELPLVQKGDMVLIIVESSLVKISATGEALEKGQRGDTIRVRNTSSSREVRAQVIDKKTVRISL